MLNFNIKYDDYFQTKNAADDFVASVASKDVITEADLMYGRMPENSREVVIDAFILNKMIEKGGWYRASQVGINNIEKFLGREINAGGMSEMYQNTSQIKLDSFTIVGISNLTSPCIYMDKSNFVNLFANTSEATSDSYGGIITLSSTNVATTEQQVLTQNIYDVNLAKDKIELSKGKMPENDYEIIVNESNSSIMKLNKTIDEKINGNNLKVVGYYTSNEDINFYFTTENTIKYKLLSEKSNITIYSNNKEETINYFRNSDKNIENIYETDKDEYVRSVQESIKSSIIVAVVILVISLVEIFLMIRSSFLSRVKEVGILRAIGVKKKDIYKMFLGEIIAITTLTAIPGLFLMSYIIQGLRLVPYYADQFMFNSTVVLISVAILVVFNIMIGLLPVRNVIRKTPARILSGNNVD